MILVPSVWYLLSDRLDMAARIWNPGSGSEDLVSRIWFLGSGIPYIFPPLFGVSRWSHSIFNRGRDEKNIPNSVPKNYKNL